MAWLWIVLTTCMYVLSLFVLLVPYGAASMIKQAVIVGALGAALCLHGGLLYTWIDIAPCQTTPTTTPTWSSARPS